MALNIRQKLRQSRGFIFALVAVTIVWIITAVSEHKPFTEAYHARFDGVDTARFAILEADSLLSVEITSNGFMAFNRGIHRTKELHINIGKMIHNVAANAAPVKSWEPFDIVIQSEDLSELIKGQIDMRGVDNFRVVQKSAHVRLAQRERRAFVPDISQVDFQFKGMAGLYGHPSISPDTIYLYGSRTSLDKIQQVRASRQTISNITKSGSYRVALDPEWSKYPDLRSSDSHVNLSIPVDNFIEQELTVRISVGNNDIDAASNAKVNLYPPQVTVRYLMPQSKYRRLSGNDLQIKLSKECQDCNTLKPLVVSFPSDVRIKAIEPSEIQYIVIE